MINPREWADFSIKSKGIAGIQKLNLILPKQPHERQSKIEIYEEDISILGGKINFQKYPKHAKIKIFPTKQAIQSYFYSSQIKNKPSPCDVCLHLSLITSDLTRIRRI